MPSNTNVYNNEVEDDDDDEDDEIEEAKMVLYTNSLLLPSSLLLYARHLFILFIFFRLRFKIPSNNLEEENPLFNNLQNYHHLPTILPHQTYILMLKNITFLIFLKFLPF